jgi:hypothetical protein
MIRRLRLIATVAVFLAASAKGQSPSSWTQWPSTWIRWDGGIANSFYSILQNNGIAVPQEPILNFIPGTNITFTFTDNPGTGVTGLTINSTGGGGGAFSGLTGGTNTTAAMVVGTGASLGTSGAGTITASAMAVGGLTGLGSGVGTWLATPSAANFASALSGQLTVATGGTGAGTFTANGVLIGEGTSPFDVTAAGTTGQCLTGVTGADPVWGSCGSGFVNLQATTPGTQQGSAGSGNINTNGTWIEELDALAAVTVNGVIIQNTTAATAGALSQYPPSYAMCGQEWNTGGTPATNTDCVRWEPLFGSGNPTAAGFRFTQSLNGGAFTSLMSVSTAGTVTFLGGANLSGNVATSVASGTFSQGATGNGTGGFGLTGTNGAASLITTNHLVSASCTSGTTCATTTNIPANVQVLAIGYRVTTTITGPTSIGFGTAANATSFCTGLTTLTSGNTGGCGGGSTGASGFANASAAALQITATGGAFTAGVVEFQITYILITPPTS